MTAEHPNPFRTPEPVPPPAPAGPYAPPAGPGPYAPPPPPGGTAGHGIPSQQPAPYPSPYAPAPPPQPAPFPPSPYAPAAYAAQGYGTPGGTPLWPAPPRNGVATAAMVSGIVSASLCWTFFLSPATLAAGITALVLGRIALMRIRRGAAAGRTKALAGLWTGLGGTVVSAVLTVLLVAWIGASTPVDSDAGSEWLAGPSEQVTWDDGLSVTFDRPRAQDGGTEDEGVVVLVANVMNDGDGTVDVSAGDFRALADDARVARGDVLRSAPRDTVRPGQTLRVRFEVTVPADTGVVGVDYAPGGGHDTGFWEFDVETGPAGDGAGSDGGLSGNPGGDSLDV
ncbi:DUF4190 domain-containing protein [Streptomyces sp. NPDC049879]|uniref:DUF4190 domain-containing protein n=1 Tax=Streptomyces sp. NPDC049879 TaxID=3365598 RepID=UPI0037B71A78